MPMVVRTEMSPQTSRTTRMTVSTSRRRPLREAARVTEADARAMAIPSGAPWALSLLCLVATGDLNKPDRCYGVLNLNFF